MDQFTLDKIAAILTAQGAILKSLEERAKIFEDEVKSLTSQIVVLRAEIEDMRGRDAPMAVAAPAKGRKAR